MQHTLYQAIFLIICFTYYTPPCLTAQTLVGQELIGENDFDYFGCDVSISADGTRMAVGAYGESENGAFSGKARVYELINDSWTQIGKDFTGKVFRQFLGFEVELSQSGDRIALSSSMGLIETRGSILIYDWNGMDWVQVGDSLMLSENYRVGEGSISFSANADRLVTNAIAINQDLPPGAMVWDWNGTEWVQLGGIILAENSIGFRGQLDLSDDGRTFLVGAQNSNSLNGIVYVFHLNDSGNWELKGNPILGGDTDEKFGFSAQISADGNRLVAGAIHGISPSLVQVGHVKCYEFVDENWTQRGATIYGETETGNMGANVVLSPDGNRFAAAELLNDANGLNTGKIKVFEWSDNNWTQISEDITPSEVPNAVSGTGLSFALNGGRLAIGGQSENTNPTGPGFVKVYDLTQPTYLSEYDFAEGIVFPNPTHGKVNLLNSDWLSIQVLNVQGQVLSRHYHQQSSQISLTHLPRGSYFLLINTPNGKQVTKIIKK